MPSRLCIAFGPSCSGEGIAVSGTSRCAAHSRGWRKTPQMRARSARYNTRAWRERAKRQLKTEPLCRQCGTRAAIADHIFNVGSGGSFDGALQSLCRRCHSRKTASEGGRAAKAKRGKER